MSKNKEIYTLVLVFLALSITCQSLERTKNPSIIIIGAGPSGIAAATKLLKNNITNIKILEAEDRIGGRINSVKFGDAIIELGAEYCEGENLVYDLVKEYDILKESTVAMRKAYLSNGEQISQDLFKKIDDFIYSLSDADEDELCKKLRSFGDCLDVR